MTNRKILPLFFVLILLVVVIPTYADTQFGGYDLSSKVNQTCPTDCQSLLSDTTNGMGNAFKNPFNTVTQIQSVSVYVANYVPTRVIVLTSTEILSNFATAYSCIGSASCSFLASGHTFTIAGNELIGGLSTFAFNTINLVNPVSVNSNSWVAVVFMVSPADTGSQKEFIYVEQNGKGVNVEDVCFLFGTSNPTIGNTINNARSGNCAQANSIIVGATFSTVASGGTQTSQCYGNCGNPAITLTNTNATSGFNFNQSITIFYQAQSNLNGLVKNVTVSIGATTLNGNLGILALYTVDVQCTTSNNPFTPQCPGLLQKSQSINTVKGKQSMLTNVQVIIGQWIGIGLSFSFSGASVNGTNTDVTMYQASGKVPTVINAFSTISLTRPALFAFITGSGVIVTIPPPIETFCTNIACGLLQLVDNFGAGRVAGGLFWMMIFWGTMTFLLVYVSRPGEHFGVESGGLNLPFEVHIMTFLIFAIFFSALGALPAWIPILIFFFVALLGASKLRGQLS